VKLATLLAFSTVSISQALGFVPLVGTLLEVPKNRKKYNCSVIE
jgi:hypothetical protein